MSVQKGYRGDPHLAKELAQVEMVTQSVIHTPRLLLLDPLHILNIS